MNHTLQTLIGVQQMVKCTDMWEYTYVESKHLNYFFCALLQKDFGKRLSSISTVNYEYIQVDMHHTHLKDGRVWVWVLCCLVKFGVSKDIRTHKRHLNLYSHQKLYIIITSITIFYYYNFHHDSCNYFCYQSFTLSYTDLEGPLTSLEGSI